MVTFDDVCRLLSTSMLLQLIQNSLFTGLRRKKETYDATKVVSEQDGLKVVRFSSVLSCARAGCLSSRLQREGADWVLSARTSVCCFSPSDSATVTACTHKHPHKCAGTVAHCIVSIPTKPLEIMIYLHTFSYTLLAMNVTEDHVLEV